MADDMQAQAQTFPFMAPMAPTAVEPPPRPLPERLRAATRPEMVQVAPGRWAPRAGGDAPDMTLARWHREPDGTYTPIPCAERMAKLTNRLCRLLGIPGQAETLRRLSRAGNIEMIKISPQIYLLNLDSWFNHLRRCAEDPELWDKGSPQYRNYIQAQGWVAPAARRQVAGCRGRPKQPQPKTDKTAPSRRFRSGGVSTPRPGGENQNANNRGGCNAMPQKATDAERAGKAQLGAK